MNSSRRTAMCASVIGGVLASIGMPRGVYAQVLTKNARMVIGWPAGGSTDAAGRVLAHNMANYASALTVDNRPGAGGRIGVEHLKTADADGSVFLISPASMFVIYPHVYQKLSYDPLQDFTAVTRVCKFPFAISVGPAVPASVKTLPDFVQWCRANPREAQYAIAAAGSGTHFAGVMLARATGVPLSSVPYKGDAPSIQDLMGGQIAAGIHVLGAVLPQLGSGRLRVLATTGAARSLLTPDVPTVAETHPGYLAEEWFGTFVPRKTPQDAVARLNSALQDALKTAAVQQAFAKLGFEVAGESGASFASIVKADLERWGPIVKASGFKAEE